MTIIESQQVSIEKLKTLCKIRNLYFYTYLIYTQKSAVRTHTLNMACVSGHWYPVLTSEEIISLCLLSICCQQKHSGEPQIEIPESLLEISYYKY